MKMLFIEGGTRYNQDKNGNIFAQSNMCEKSFQNYKEYGTYLTVFGRIYNDRNANDIDFSKWNSISNNYNFVLVEDIYCSKKKYFNLYKRKRIKESLYKCIKEADFIIIRSISNFYTINAARICRKLNKEYLIEVTGFAFETKWYRKGIDSKVLAFYSEYNQKKEVRFAPYVIYVTNNTLQKRYPTNGKSIGCSDVELQEIFEKNLLERYKRIDNDQKIVIGTIGNLNAKLKGQIYVIKAIEKLKNEGNIFEYRLLGRGKNRRIEKYISKKGLDNVYIDGAISHENVYKWLENIDVYIQPSYTEGLSRSIIEAMSKGCLISASDVGGNKELCPKEYLFKKKKTKDIYRIIKSVTKKELINEAKSNINKAKMFSDEFLKSKKRDFMKNIMTGGQ